MDKAFGGLAVNQRFLYILFFLMISTACAPAWVDQKVSENNPRVCPCDSHRHRSECYFQTKDFVIEYSIKRGAIPGSYELQGKATLHEGVRQDSLERQSTSNRFFLYLVKDRVIVDRVEITMKDDNYALSYPLIGYFESDGFDAVILDYTIKKSDTAR